MWNQSSAWFTQTGPWESPQMLAAMVFEESAAAASGKDPMEPGANLS